MAKIQELTTEELELFIEQKVSEILGDPDCELELREDFKKRLEQRLKNPSRTVSQAEVEKKFG